MYTMYSNASLAGKTFPLKDMHSIRAERERHSSSGSGAERMLPCVELLRVASDEKLLFSGEARECARRLQSTSRGGMATPQAPM